MSETTYDPSMGYDDPDGWPDKETEFGKLLNYLRSATECSAISIHRNDEDAKHATFYAKNRVVHRGVTNKVRERGYKVHIGGMAETPPETAHASWVADGHELEMKGFIEIRRADDE